MINKILLGVCVAVLSANGVDASGRKTLFNDNWQFHLTDSLTKTQSVESIAGTATAWICSTSASRLWTR